MKKLISILFIIIIIMTLVSCKESEIEISKKPFPEFESKDFNGNILSNDNFKNYDATLVNFWSNGCGSCIAEMPELEEYYQNLKERNINFIGVAVSADESEEEYEKARLILEEKGVAYTNIIPNIDSSFYKNFINEITGYPTTYIVDSEGNIVGAPIVGVVKNQEDVLIKRLDEISK